MYPVSLPRVGELIVRAAGLWLELWKGSSPKDVDIGKFARKSTALHDALGDGARVDHGVVERGAVVRVQTVSRAMHVLVVEEDGDAFSHRTPQRKKPRQSREGRRGAMK